MNTPSIFHIAAIHLLIPMLLLGSSDVQSVAGNATPAEHYTFTIDSNTIPTPPDDYKFNNISIRARRDFLNRYKNAGNALWYKVDDGIIARFISGERSIAVAYTNTGEWLHTITGYNEKSMSKEVRSLVKSIYYGFVIVHVAEIQIPANNSHIFLVFIQDTGQITVLRICDGEMQVLHNSKRG